MIARMDGPGNSIDEWYPLVRGVVPTPRTEILVGTLDLTALLYEPPEPQYRELRREFARVVDWVREQGDRRGWPLFLRTGLTSAKHRWRDSCHVPGTTREDIARHVDAIIEYSAMADFMGLPCDVWAARELLPTYGLFEAFDGMPVTRERRYFVHDGRVIGHHPYWPPEAVAETATAPNWRELLDIVNAEDEAEIAELTAMTERVGGAVGGAWSVDWLWVHRPKGNDGGSGWYLTDMALAADSFVWWEHPSAPAKW